MGFIEQDCVDGCTGDDDVDGYLLDVTLAGL